MFISTVAIPFKNLTLSGQIRVVKYNGKFFSETRRIYGSGT